jgi:3-oxoacyl-[acyl-carrier protein] reductase
VFASEGAKVVVHGRDRDAGASVVDEIGKAGGEAMFAAADVRDFASIEAMRGEIEREFGAVDVLVTNAGGGGGQPMPVESIAVEDWRTALDENLTSVFLTIKSFLPAMKEARRGSIVTIASSAARNPHRPAPIAYGAAKAGVILLTRDVAVQAGANGVRVNCIAPSTILTPSNENRIPEQAKASLAASHPLQRLGAPKDVAEAALFLASDQSSWITGVVLDVAGGAVMI